jgi:hypothetical protein
MLALPAEACCFRQRLLHHGGGVDEHLHIAAGLRDEPARQRLEARLDDLVIVVALRVDRDRAVRALLQDRQRIVVGAVVHPEHDDRARLRPDRARIAAPLRRIGKPVHVAVRALGEELLEPPGRLRDGIRPRDPDHVEAVIAGGGGECSLERGGVVQKSRSA